MKVSNKISLLVLWSLFLPAAQLIAVENPIVHIPPEFADSDTLTIKINAAGISRARVLQSAVSGIKVIEMVASLDHFVAELNSHQTPLFKYKIQALSENLESFESASFVVEKTSAMGSVNQVRSKFSEEHATQLSKITQLKNAIYSLKAADSLTLARNKAAELERARKALQSKERYLTLADQESRDEFERVFGTGSRADRAQEIDQLRAEIFENAGRLVEGQGL